MKARKKTSKIWSIDKEVLQEVIDKSSTMVQILTSLGLNPYNGNHKTLKSRIEIDNLNLSVFNINYLAWKKSHLENIKPKTPLNKILVEDSTYARCSLKKRLFNEGIKKQKCEICEIGNEWNSKPLILQLDHANGINNDNRLENLRILCPNCHSQSDTFAGKNAKKETEKTYCSICKIETSGYSKVCNKCSRPRIFNVGKADLEKYAKDMPFTKIGKMFGVTDNCVRKRCEALGIPIPKYPRGYWLKIR